MNEILRIHLGRVSYEIDVAAKKELEKYLTAVRKSLGSEIDAMEDIEIRMTEILAERGVNKDSVITEQDVRAIIDQLGEPKAFSSVDDGDEKTSNGSDAGKKKYYRDTENAVLGGVLSGLAAYTGWDVTVLRVLAVVFTVVPTWGFLILIYIVVWICTPEAKSASEKLEMRGEPVNLDSIKEAAKTFGEKAEKVGTEMSEKVQKVSQDTTTMNTVGRVFMLIFGICGIVVSVSLLMGLIISTMWLIMILANAQVAALPLLVVTVGLALGFVFMLVIMMLTGSAALASGHIEKGHTASVVSLVLMLVFMVSALVSGSAWLSTAGQQGVDQVVDLVSERVHVELYDGDNRVKVDIEPFKLDVDINR
jgi:phage shock protein PspC (stress-responsive transcriptional regulator)